MLIRLFLAIFGPLTPTANPLSRNGKAKRAYHNNLLLNNCAALIEMAHRGDPALRYHPLFSHPMTRDMLCVPLDSSQLQHIRACTEVERYDVVCDGVVFHESLIHPYVILSVSVDFSGMEPDATGNLHPYTLSIENCHVKFSLPLGKQPAEILGNPEAASFPEK